MFLYPHRIFTVSKGKRLIDPESRKLVGIYDAKKFDYHLACTIAENNDYAVSVLLGEIGKTGTRLIVLDLDDCYDQEGNLEKDTEEFLKEFSEEEYETSSSGTGIHIYILTKLDLETFIVKNMEGCKSFECYTNTRHIVTTLFDFENTNLLIGKHDKFLKDLYNKANEARGLNEPSRFEKDVINIFKGERINSEEELRGKMLGRTPVTDMFTLRKIGFKDPMIISVIDENPDAVDQSAHDAKLIRKLMYYTLSFDSAWEMAKKTNYYKAKDERHKKKFDDVKYKERTRNLISRGL